MTFEAAFLLAADVYLAPKYIPSAVNPADPPSRRRSLRAWLARMRAAVVELDLDSPPSADANVTAAAVCVRD